MAIDMKDVTYVTIPEAPSHNILTGTKVDKIEDSNGNTIWVRPSKYLLRRLEYIHFNGAEYINTEYVPNYNTSIKFKLNVVQDVTSGDSNNVLFGAYCNTLTDTSRRLYWIWSVNASPKQYRTAIGGTWTYTNVKSTDINWFGIGMPNNTAFKNAAFGIRSADWSSVLYYDNHTNSTAFTGWSAPFTIGSQGNTGGTGVDQSRYSNINVYEGYQHNVASPWQTDIGYSAIRHWIPCQRKDDGVCGLYDVINLKFYPMVGTNITDAAAGPVVDEYWEYWNMTA